MQLSQATFLWIVLDQAADQRIRPMARQILTVVAFILGCTTFPASAQYLACSKPTPPHCVRNSYTYEDDMNFQNCRSDLERYLDNVERYRECLIDKASAVRSEANQTVEEFNCRADGHEFCP